VPVEEPDGLWKGVTEVRLSVVERTIKRLPKEKRSNESIVRVKQGHTILPVSLEG
jgi:hypothetical protein